MTEETVILMNKILSILGKMSYEDCLPEFYFNSVDKNFIYWYIGKTILKDFTKEELDQLKSKIFNVKDNYDRCGIFKNKIYLPNIISSIITIHKLNHYVALKNKSRYFSYMSLYDELIPMNSEFVFISKFYNEHLGEFEKIKFDSLIKASYATIELSSNGKIEGIDEKDSIEAINKLSHINSGLILMQNNNYIKNEIIFDEINRTSNPLEYEFNKRAIYLSKNIINELKNRN